MIVCNYCGEAKDESCYGFYAGHVSMVRCIECRKKVKADGAANYRSNNKKIISNRDKKYYKKNKKHITKNTTAYKKMKYRTDPLYRMKDNVRCIMKRAIKTQRTEMILGCTFEEFKIYMESKFTDGMAWNNYGFVGWHIDHIKPLSWFDLNDPAQVAIANHYTNLQPLWAFDNFSKHNRYEG